jgi:hypothetical protein
MENKKYTPDELREILKLAFERENNVQLSDIKKAAAELGVSEEEFRNAEELYQIDKKIAEREAIKKRQQRTKLIVLGSILAVLLTVVIYYNLPRGAYQGKYEAYLTTNEKNFLYYGGTENIQEFYALENKYLVCQLQILEPQYRRYAVDFKLFTPQGRLKEERNYTAYRHENKNLNFAMGSFGFYGFPIHSANVGDWKVEIYVDKKLLHTQKIAFKLAKPHLSIGLLPHNQWDKATPPIIKNQFSQSTELSNASYRLEAQAEFSLCQSGIFSLECSNPQGEVIAANQQRFDEKNGYRGNYDNNNRFKFTLSLPLKSTLEKTQNLGKYKLTAYCQDFGQTDQQRIKLEEYAFELTK